ncbi:unnamed protein product [Rhizophagus irregularis]|nr:unnamed protein product [Rhizophagus irregularis]
MLTWCGSPSSLATHLSGAHGITKEIAMKHNEEELKNPPESSIKPYKHSKQESLTQNVIGFVIGIVQPLNVVEDPDFIKMINGFDKRYKVPCTKNRISKTFEIGKVTLKNQDAWSSPAHLHWKTSDFEPNEVLLTCNEIGIGERIPCAAHTLQLSIGKGLDKIRQLVDKCKCLITFFAGDKKKQQLKEAQMYLHRQLIILKPAIAILKASLISNVSSNIHKEGEKLEELYPTVHEWKVIKEIVHRRLRE